MLTKYNFLLTFFFDVTKYWKIRKITFTQGFSSKQTIGVYIIFSYATKHIKIRKTIFKGKNYILVGSN